MVAEEEKTSLREEAEKLAPSTGPWKVDDAFEGDNWLICSLGNSGEDAKNYTVTTDGIHASEFEGDAKTDAEFIVRVRNHWWTLKRMLGTEDVLGEARSLIEQAQEEIEVVGMGIFVINEDASRTLMRAARMLHRARALPPIKREEE